MLGATEEPRGEGMRVVSAGGAVFHGWSWYLFFMNVARSRLLGEVHVHASTSTNLAFFWTFQCPWLCPTCSSAMPCPPSAAGKSNARHSSSQFDLPRAVPFRESTHLSVSCTASNYDTRNACFFPMLSMPRWSCMAWICSRPDTNAHKLQ